MEVAKEVMDAAKKVAKEMMETGEQEKSLPDHPAIVVSRKKKGLGFVLMGKFTVSEEELFLYQKY